MKGTDKQINYASNLIEKAQKLVARFDGGKKEKLIIGEKAALGAINGNTDAGRIIEVLNPESDIRWSAYRVNKGWNTVEEMINYLNS